MPTTLLIIYRILGAALFALAAAAIVEKYRTVRGAALLPARVLECRKAASTSPNRSAGGYRYLVELHANGQRLELETNDSFWFKHDKTVGKAIQVWYNPNARCVERKSWETEIFSAVLALPLIHIWRFRRAAYGRISWAAQHLTKKIRENILMKATRTTKKDTERT